MEYVWAHGRYLKAQVDEVARWNALTDEQKKEALAMMYTNGAANGSVEQ